MTEVSAPTVFRLKTLRNEGDERREATTSRASCYSKHFLLSHKATEEPKSSGIKQRLTYVPDTDRRRSLGIRDNAPCRFVSYL